MHGPDCAAGLKFAPIKIACWKWLVRDCPGEKHVTFWLRARQRRLPAGRVAKKIVIGRAVAAIFAPGPWSGTKLSASGRFVEEKELTFL
jgi:hypothetical protein